jgi:hypothetical protein
MLEAALCESEASSMFEICLHEEKTKVEPESRNMS